MIISHWTQETYDCLPQCHLVKDYWQQWKPSIALHSTIDQGTGKVHSMLYMYCLELLLI